MMFVTQRQLEVCFLELFDLSCFSVDNSFFNINLQEEKDGFTSVFSVEV